MKLYEVIQWVDYDGDVSYGFFSSEAEAAEAREHLIAWYTRTYKTGVRHFTDRLHIDEHEPTTLEEFKKEYS